MRSENGYVPTDPGAGRVLVVDDDLSQRMMLVRILKKGDYESAVAMSTEEARTQLRDSQYGLVISDLRMFAEDGIELVRYVSDNCPDTYSIVVSGFVSEDDTDRIRRAGAYDVMIRPVDPDTLLEKVKEAFDDRARSVAERRHRSNW